MLSTPTNFVKVGYNRHLHLITTLKNWLLLIIAQGFLIMILFGDLFFFAIGIFGLKNTCYYLSPACGVMT